MPRRLLTKEEFYSKATPNPLNGCWEWQASVRAGYGQQSVNNVMMGAHRVSWEFTNGRIPTGKWVLHKCDNPICINPEHLFLGTALDNTNDRRSKGRTNYTTPKVGLGSDLTEQNIKDIRALHPIISARNLAVLFKTSLRNIYDIKNRVNWRHIPKLTEQEIIEIRTKYASQYT